MTDIDQQLANNQTDWEDLPSFEVELSDTESNLDLEEFDDFELELEDEELILNTEEDEELVAVPDDFEFQLDEILDVEPDNALSDDPASEAVLSAEANTDVNHHQANLDNQTELASCLSQLRQSITELTQALTDPPEAEKKDTEQDTANTPSAEDYFKEGVLSAKNKNYLKSAKAFRKASLVGHSKAMLYLGLMYSKGQGLPQSPLHAYTWLKLSTLWQCNEALQPLQELEKYLTVQEIKTANRIAADKQELIFNEID
ncbi:hypothetical protein C2869_00260 [Saccharobesus litoralis]|uniref:Sel1 repeat family protein n=1 Tax=Saccharobesus litoralis TaxID=2172099 RepID=A0A2S0VL86_9ALTE|nr:sel1 repeat family protein [Saccharobesus litoralis]AWB64966.1 hypothetical protein C2869_00260 [Saccharobesus litoralis]